MFPANPFISRETKDFQYTAKVQGRLNGAVPILPAFGLSYDQCISYRRNAENRSLQDHRRTFLETNCSIVRVTARNGEESPDQLSVTELALGGMGAAG